MKIPKLIQRIFLFTTSLFLTFVFSITHINAQTAPFYWEFINVDIAVQNNGDMLVTETQKYTFTGDYKNQRYRYIPVDKVKEITDVSVSENNQIIPSNTEIENNHLRIKWEHPLKAPESHTFVINYRVIGGLHKSGDNLQVYWKAIFADRFSPIQKSRVTVKFPEELAGKISKFESFGIPSNIKQIDDKNFEFTAKQPLPPQTELEVKITFPNKILNVTDVSSNSSFSHSNTKKFPLSQFITVIATVI
ncbi:MAG: DUF2207 domain-containing protein, partial [Methylacidiphilales bacterium]|nr:DUF2207 domain-containing protein [Candidatus Methylacidiphilales bacterium]